MSTSQVTTISGTTAPTALLKQDAAQQTAAAAWLAITPSRLAAAIGQSTGGEVKVNTAQRPQRHQQFFPSRHPNHRLDHDRVGGEHAAGNHRRRHIPPGPEKGDGRHFPERPAGCFAKMRFVPFFGAATESEDEPKDQKHVREVDQDIGPFESLGFAPPARIVQNVSERADGIVAGDAPAT